MDGGRKCNQYFTGASTTLLCQAARYAQAEDVLSLMCSRVHEELSGHGMRSQLIDIDERCGGRDGETFSRLKVKVCDGLHDGVCRITKQTLTAWSATEAETVAMSECLKQGGRMQTAGNRLMGHFKSRRDALSSWLCGIKSGRRGELH